LRAASLIGKSVRQHDSAAVSILPGFGMFVTQRTMIEPFTRLSLLTVGHGYLETTFVGAALKRQQTRRPPLSQAST